MPEHLHARLFVEEGSVIEVTSDTQANVILTTDSNYSAYKAGRGYTFHGGFFTHFPARLSPPSSGYWNVILDLGGRVATVRHSIRVIKP